MKKRYWFLIILLAVGGWVAYKKLGKSEETTEVTTGKAQRGDITRTVTATGKVFPEVEVKISSEVAGEIVELSVKDGQSVEKGELLVRVNPDTLEAQVMQEEAALRATKSNSAEAKARMLQAELDLKRLRSLLEKGFATEEQVEAGTTQVEIATASYSSTLSRIEQQEMSLKERRDSLAKATTYSPIFGTVTALGAELGDRVVGTGQFEGTEIMRVANLNDMEVRVDVSESDIVSVKVGDKATVEIEALPDEEFDGVVKEIANSANNSEQNNQDQLTTFLVKVKLINPSDRIRPGMTGTADIRTRTVKDIVYVPLQSVTVRSKDAVAEQLGEDTEKDESEGAKPKESGDRQLGGRGARGGSGERRGGGNARGSDNLERIVFVYDEGVAKLARVETGLADNRNIEIVSGLSEGDEVITGSYRVLTRELEHEKEVAIASKEKKKDRE